MNLLKLTRYFSFVFQETIFFFLVQKCNWFNPLLGNVHGAMHHTVVSQWYHARMTGLSKSSCICSYIMPSLVFRIKASTQWALGRDCRYIEGAARHTWRTGSWSPKEYTNRGRGTGSAHWLLDRHIHLLMLDSLLLRIERFWADIGESMY